VREVTASNTIDYEAYKPNGSSNENSNKTYGGSQHTQNINQNINLVTFISISKADIKEANKIYKRNKLLKRTKLIYSSINPTTLYTLAETLSYETSIIVDGQPIITLRPEYFIHKFRQLLLQENDQDLAYIFNVTPEQIQQIKPKPPKPSEYLTPIPKPQYHIPLLLNIQQINYPDKPLKTSLKHEIQQLITQLEQLFETIHDKKHYSVPIQLAQKLLKQKTSLDDDDIDTLYDYFKTWLQNTNEKRIHLYDENNDKHLFIPIKTRFHRIKYHLYKYNQAWKQALNKHNNTWGTFLTLTFYHNSNIYDAWKKASKYFNNFMSWLVKKLWLKKKIKYRPDYIKVLEPHENGYVHIHMALFNMPYIEAKDVIKEWEKLDAGKIIKMKGFRIENGRAHFTDEDEQQTNKNVKNYMKKYFIKSIIEKTEQQEQIKFNKKITLYWATLTRFFTMSRRLLLGLNFAMHTNQVNHLITFLGIVYEYEERYYTST
jgi:hypothetical protein